MAAPFWLGMAPLQSVEEDVDDRQWSGRAPSPVFAAAVVAEWLRRLTRNQIPSGSVGSSPTDRGSFSVVAIRYC